LFFFFFFLLFRALSIQCHFPTRIPARDFVAQVFEGLAHVLNLILKNNKIDALEEFHILQANKVINLRFEGNHLLQNPAPGAVQIHVSNKPLIVFASPSFT